MVADTTMTQNLIARLAPVRCSHPTTSTKHRKSLRAITALMVLFVGSVGRVARIGGFGRVESGVWHN